LFQSIFKDGQAACHGFLIGPDAVQTSQQALAKRVQLSCLGRSCAGGAPGNGDILVQLPQQLRLLEKERTEQPS
jgi:hypothetical protein